jgi:hypothetical protein
MGSGFLPGVIRLFAWKLGPAPVGRVPKVSFVASHQELPRSSGDHDTGEEWGMQELGASRIRPQSSFLACHTCKMWVS